MEFCGRILMFLAHFFPLSERSGNHYISLSLMLVNIYIFFYKNSGAGNSH